MGVMADLAIMSKSKGNSKCKAINNDRYYNCYKFGHFEKDCRNTNTNQQLSTKHKRPKPNKPKNRLNLQNYAHIAAAIDENPNLKLFQSSMANIMNKSKI